MLKFALFVLLTFSVSADGFSAWRQRAWTILDEGSRHEEMEVQMLTLFGAKLSQDEGAMTFYMRALKSPKPELQLAAIKSLASLKNDRADEALQEGLRSNEVIIRLETLLLMAQKGMQGVSDHVEGLMAKIPKPLHVIFPPLFAMAGDPSSLKQLRLLLSDSDDRVRAASAMSVEKGGIEEFLPHIRRLAKQVSPIVQEAAAHCLGVFGDSTSLPILKKMITSPFQEVKITALQAYALLNEEEALPLLTKEADVGDLFAITLLGTLSGGEQKLKTYLRSNDPHIAINAAMALLARGERDGLRIIAPLILSNRASLAPHATSLKHVIAWKLAPSGPYDDPVIEERMRESRREIVRRIFLLPEEDALAFSKELLLRGENGYIPAVMEQLYISGTPGVVALLEQFQQKIGAPYVRGAAALTLFKLGQKERRTEMISFLKSHHAIELIRLKPMVDDKLNPFATTAFELSPEETSSLYIEMLEALLTEGKEDGIDLLVEAMEKGHPHNRYALAGLLIRATL